MTREFTRWSFEVPLASRGPELLRNAMRISTTPPGGATFLSIPTNVAEAKGKAEIYPRELFTVPIRTKPDPYLIEQATCILISYRSTQAHHHPRVQFIDAARAAMAHLGRGKKELYGRTLGSGLGWSVGAAIGIKMAKPDRQTVCLVGDGAFMMGQIEALWAARRFEAPVLYVVFNNRSFNDTRMRVSAIAPRLRESKLDMGSYLGNPDVSFETAAKAFDVNGATVTRPGEIAPALAHGIKELKDRRPFLIDVIAERVDLLAESTWYPKYSIAERRTKQV